MCKYRIGHGYDVHKLVIGRRLILGGVEIPYEQGLLGHSDADVLIHAIMDAVIGALGIGDIGKYFPDSDAAYKDISSVELLKKVKELLVSKSAEVVNVDATVIAERPKISSYIPGMKKIISEALNVDVTQINIKATTEEGLGFTGRKEGISAHAVVLIELE